MSKNLVGPYWSWWKVSRQMQATVLFLRAFGVELKVPTVRLEDFQAYPPRDVKVVVNGQALDPANPHATLTPGAPLDVCLTGPKQRSPLAPILCAKASDRAGLNLLEARRLPLTHFESLALTADGLPLMKAKLTWAGGVPKNHAHTPPAESAGDLLCWLNGVLKAIAPGQTLTAVEGDQLVLEGIAGSARPEVLNLKGYVSRPEHDDGQDAGVEIILDAAMFQPRYVVRKSAAETVCEIVRETPGVNPRPRFLLRILPRQVEHLVLTDEAGRTLRLAWAPGKPLALPPGRYTLADIQGNGPAGKVQAFLGRTPIVLGKPFQLADKAEIVLRQATTFRELGKMSVNGRGLIPGAGGSPGLSASNPQSAVGSGS